MPAVLGAIDDVAREGRRDHAEAGYDEAQPELLESSVVAKRLASMVARRVRCATWRSSLLRSCVPAIAASASRRRKPNWCEPRRSLNLMGERSKASSSITINVPATAL